MDTLKYKAFLKVYESGSLTLAAKQLGYSQPGISHMIDSLEKELGFSLLERKKDRIVPTEDGKKIIYSCYQIVTNEENLNEIADSVNGLLSGKIKIGAYNSMLVHFVPKVISVFSSTYSNIEIELKENAIQGIITDLKNSDIDIGFTNEAEIKDLDFIPLFNDPVRLVVSKDHPFASCGKVSVDSLNGCDFIMPPPGYDDVVKIVMDSRDFHPNIRYHIASDTAGIEMAANNLGVYIISSMQTPFIPKNAVAMEIEGDFHRVLGMYLKSAKHAKPALKRFVEISKQVAESSFK